MKKAKIYYHAVDDYLSREQKLDLVRRYRSVINMQAQGLLAELTPNEHGDWISVRNDAFSTFIPLEPEKKFDAKTKSFFLANIVGVATARDAWVLNFSKEKLKDNMRRMIDFYNEQTESYARHCRLDSQSPTKEVEDFIDQNPTKISWSVNLKKDVEKGCFHKYFENEQKIGMYRPFTKQWLYFDRKFIERPGLWSQIFPTENHRNPVISIEGTGSSRDFGCLITDKICDYSYAGIHNQSFPLYYYEENNATQKGLFDEGNEKGFVRRDAVSDFILERAKTQYGKNVGKEDIFFYVYGFLHSKEYRETFANDLKKMLPRLPLVESVKDFWTFSKAGRQLAELHLNYETPLDSVQKGKLGIIEIYAPLSIADTLRQANAKEMEYLNYSVQQMHFPKGQKAKDRPATIIYNSQIIIENIPPVAYDYVVNGKSTIEWIMERYAITTHKESSITNNPNDWAREQGKPKYILDLLLSVINVSVRTVEIVENLPKVEFESIICDF
jgi:predicted helicase